jgi:dynein heavy chain
MGDMVDEWVIVQKNWRYLSNIFKGPDIRQALPEESKLFEQVDKFFRALMKRTNNMPLLIKIARNAVHNTLEDLKKNNANLDHIQKKLDDYMELKRAAFPRFYFLSSDELIDILANSQNLSIIQGHLKTCFDNIVKLELDDIDILGMHSNEKELVKFFKTRFARGNIEKWLNEVQDEMILTLRRLMKEGNKEYEPGAKRRNFVLEKKGQIVATVAQIQWCLATEMALQNMEDDQDSL